MSCVSLHLVLAGDALVDVGQGDLESVGRSDLEAEDVSRKVGRSPVPSLDGQLPVQHLLAVSGGEELGQSLAVVVAETRETVEFAVAGEDPDSPGASQPLPVDHLDVLLVDRLRLGSCTRKKIL